MRLKTGRWATEGSGDKEKWGREITQGSGNGRMMGRTSKLSKTVNLSEVTQLASSGARF